MSKKVCKNNGCKKPIKSKRKFCSMNCFLKHKRSFPSKYKSGRFNKGDKSPTKGMRFTKIGDTKIMNVKLKSGETRGRRFIFIGQYQKNGNPKYIRNDKYVWLKERSKIPSGYVLWHKDGRTLNDNIENLELIKFAEALSRYSLHKKKIFNLNKEGHIQKIIDGCVNGDRRVQKQLYEMLYPKMFVVALRYSPNREIAKDVISDSFFKLFTNIKKIKAEKKNIEGWMRRVVVNTGIDYLRKNGKIRNITDSIDDVNNNGEETDFIFNKIYEDENFSEKLDGEYVVKMIQELPKSYKLAFNMVIIEGMTHKKVAEKLGISEGTSKSNLSKARKILREKIIELHKEENYETSENLYSDNILWT